MASQKSISDSEAGSQSIASDGSKQTKMKGFLEEAGMVKRPNDARRDWLKRVLYQARRLQRHRGERGRRPWSFDGPDGLSWNSTGLSGAKSDAVIAQPKATCQSRGAEILCDGL